MAPASLTPEGSLRSTTSLATEAVPRGTAALTSEGGLRSRVPEWVEAVRITLVAEAGSYALTGNAALFHRKHRMAAEAGSYVLSGQDALFHRKHTLAAAAGSYVLTGQDAILTHTPAAYTANPVHFDGTNDYLTRGGALTGIADGKIVLFSGWIRAADTATGEPSRNFTILAGTSSRFVAHLSSTNRLKVTGRNSSGTIILDATGPTISDTAWHHIVWSIDLASTSNRALYLDGAAASVTWNTYNTAGTLDLNPSTSPDCLVGRYIASAPEMWFGDMADIYFQTPASYFDLSVGANLAKFINAGAPVDLGSDGSNPTGTAALVLLSGDTNTWHTNDGTGGGFTENGALTDGTGPVEL